MLENLQRDVLLLVASRGIRAFTPPYLSVAFAIYLSRLGYSTVTIPLRSSFIMGIVRPEDRGAAAGITTLSRHVPAVNATLVAYLMQSFSLNVPIFLGGFLQLFMTVLFTSSFAR